jgi:pyruvate dehydrogenase E2 component (dihydrolipoamide acetyltransferase)
MAGMPAMQEQLPAHAKDGRYAGNAGAVAGIMAAILRYSPGLRRRACARSCRHEEVMGQISEVKVPDIGNYTNVPVIEVLVKAGDSVTKDQGLVTLESDKATMEVPAPFDGVVKELKVKVGDEISEGAIVALIEAAGAAVAKPDEVAKSETPAGAATSPPPPAGEVGARSATGEGKAATSSQGSPSPQPSPAGGRGGEIAQRTPPVAFGADTVMPDKVPYASPAVRLFARELGVDLGRVGAGSGRKGRITREDVQNFVKSALAGGGPARAGTGAGLNLLPWPQVDFSKFGEVEIKPRSKINKISGANLARNWVMIPHVTQHDDADVTELEALRVALNKENEKAGLKFTMLGFLIKAVVAALKKYPDFNASLDASGDNLVLKKYFHIGFAADTPNGLVVPVLKDADKKGIIDIARETTALAGKAREGKLGPAEMSGGCFSISSLGGIGGTAFTPIVNAPEVAILGVSKSALKPVWDGKAFQPRLLLPLSLSYDHRVIDGASAARFTAYLAQLLADMRRSLL